jgi:drug/metabolite transporter (DMT)-like permease
MLAALWGGSFVFMRVAVPAMGPVPLSFARVALAAVILLAIACAQGKSLELRARWRSYVVVGLVNCALPFVLYSYAEQFITASTAAVLNATTPFFVAIAAAIWLHEALTPRKLIGMLIGLLGVALLVGWHPEGMSRDVLLGNAAGLGAALCYGLASVYVKRRMSGVSSLPLAAGSQLLAALWLLPVLPMSVVPGPVSLLVALNVLALAIGSTVVAYIIYFKLIADVGPSRALTVTFLIPLFGVLWGFLFLDETLTLPMLAGAALIVAGTAIAVRR